MRISLLRQQEHATQKPFRNIRTAPTPFLFEEAVIGNEIERSEIGVPAGS